jgi:hypothetical protein
MSDQDPVAAPKLLSLGEIEFHDSALTRIELTTDALELEFDLYSIYYPGEPTVAVAVHDIYNLVSVRRFVASLHHHWADDQADGPFFGRVDRFGLDEVKVSTPDHRWLFLGVDDETVRIHAKNVICSLAGGSLERARTTAT